MLDLAILGLLKERAMHGYELKKQLGLRLGFFWKVSFGSLYPTLKKLERQGWVVKETPLDQSRRRQVYRITEAGEQQFLALLEEGPHTAWEDDKFSLRLAFFQYLRPETRIRLLERRKHTLEERLREGQQSLSRATSRRADSYTLSLMRHGMAVTEADISWIDGLIASERSALAQAVRPASGHPDHIDEEAQPAPAHHGEDREATADHQDSGDGQPPPHDVASGGPDTDVPHIAASGDSTKGAS